MHASSGRPCRRRAGRARITASIKAVIPLLLAGQALPSTAREAQPDGALREVEVVARRDETADPIAAASAGRVSRDAILSRPSSRPGDLLEFVPGLIVSQHSGDGKANQYYLRGFNLDHGTDFATFVDGMPVNLPSHAHGQGYTDLNFLIPELVQGIDFRKGIHAAEDGDFSSVGTARIRLADRLPRGFASATFGAYGHARLLDADSIELSRGTLLYGVESVSADGPWDLAQNLRRFNGVLRYSLGDGATRQSLTLMGYRSRWRSTDQVPQRAIAQGLIGRYGTIDPSNRGESQRASLSWNLRHLLDDGGLHANAYVVRSALDLFSNFTFFLDRPDTGDQFAQSEARRVLGGSVGRLWNGRLGERPVNTTLGLQWRHDRVTPVGLYDAQGGERADTVQESHVRQSSVGVFAQADVRWAPWLRSVAGLRVDRFVFGAHSSVPDNTGERRAGRASPRLALVFGPWAGTEVFFNAGQGFHSNDARGVNARVDPRSGEPVDPAVPLARTRGLEVGLRAEPLPGLRTSVALWSLRLDSELVFSGDAGTTEPSGASRRHGVEVDGRWALGHGLALDAVLALSQARFAANQGDAPSIGREVPGAARTVASFGASMRRGPWSGEFRIRHFGPRALIEDGSVRSRGTTLASLRSGWQIDRDLRITVDVFNLFDRKASDIDYFYVSRLPGEAPGGVADIHTHPAAPRSLRVTLTLAH